MGEFLLLALLVIAGHFGWWLYCYNRINATGLRRTTIKRIELAIIAVAIAIPVGVAIFQWPVLSALWQGESVPFADMSPLLLVWAGWSAGCGAVLGPLWLRSRTWLWPPRNLLEYEEEHVEVAQRVTAPLTGDWVTRACRCLPLNEITRLSVSYKTIELERPSLLRWRSLTIGHLSDLHFTGGLTPAYYHYVIDCMLATRPDMIALTGDIVDEDECLEWIEPILGRLSAPLGCYFLFGNHEKRLTQPQAVSERLTELGWIDLGLRDAYVDASLFEPEMAGRPSLILCGNERPWFERHVGDYWQAERFEAAAADGALKIALAHSPDRYRWAQQLGMDLMLAGHTHGGQIRIPGLGPLVAPSWYGSQFASGVFRLPPLVMHVSRGLAGTQPLRWRCTPEISLLTIVPGLDGACAAQPQSLEELSGEPSVAG